MMVYQDNPVGVEVCSFENVFFFCSNVRHACETLYIPDHVYQREIGACLIRLRQSTWKHENERNKIASLTAHA